MAKTQVKLTDGGKLTYQALKVEGGWPVSASLTEYLTDSM